MSETKNTLGIILLVIGIVVGAGGGYLYVQNNSNPIIAELTADETSLLEEIQTSESTIASLSSNVGTLQTEITDLDELIQDTQTQLDTTNTQITSLTETITQETQNVDELRNQTILLLNYERVSIYNLRFQSPIGMKLWLVPIADKPFSEQNGGLLADLSIGARDENLEYFWETLEFEADASVDLDTHVNNYIERLTESKFDYEISVGERVTTEIDGHTAYRKTIFIDYRGKEIGRATFCMWYCDETGLIFRSFYVMISYKSSLDDRYDNFWDNTYCH